MEQRAYLREELPVIGTVVDTIAQRQDTYTPHGIDGIPTTVLRLYSPYYLLEGAVEASSDTTVHLTVKHQNQGVLYQDTPTIDNNGYRNIALSLSTQTLAQGTQYAIVTIFQGDELIDQYQYRLEVQYDRLVLGETILYLDMQHIPQGEKQRFLRETKTLDGEDRLFLTYGCDPEHPQPQILMESYHQWQTIDACLSLDLQDEELLMFDYQAWYEGEFLYTVSTPEQVIRDIFGLFIHYDGIIVMNLPFWDEDTQRLTSLAGRGGLQRPSMRIREREVGEGVPLYDILLREGRNLWVETPREKITMTLYSEWDNLAGPVFPGSFYEYFLKSVGGKRNRINGGALTDAIPQRYGMPMQGGSTFGREVTVGDNELIAYDGFEETVISLDAIGKTIYTRPREILYDQPGLCRNAVLDIVREFPHRQAVQGPGQGWLMLTGRDWHTHDLRISHNGSTRQFRPHQLENGHLRHALDQSEFLTRGLNIYTIKAYNELNQEICSKVIRVHY